MGMKVPLSRSGSKVVVGAATKNGMSWWCAATAWQYVPILLAAQQATKRGELKGIGDKVKTQVRFEARQLDWKANNLFEKL